jgi:hypothetical protein
VSIVQALWFIETLGDRVNAHAMPPSDNPDGTVGLH